MVAYLRVLIGVFIAILGFTTLFSVAVDPYDILPGPHITGFNADKTRIDEDGRRVTVGQEILSGRHGTLLFGSSRVVEGFPRVLDNEAWPGGIYNAGMRGGTAFEIARALAISGRAQNLRCVIVGFDSLSFQSIVKTRATYWISALPDGNAALAAGRISLSPHAFYRGLQTVRDNAIGRPPFDRYPDVYKPGEQRERMLRGARDHFINFQFLHYDPARLEFTLAALRGLAARGVQVIGVILPRHAWHDEALYQSANLAEEDAWRADLAQAFAQMAEQPAASPCTGEKNAVLWDFSRFQTAFAPAAPDAQATQPHPHFYEATHFMTDIGEAVLARILGKVTRAPFDAPDFGVKITPRNLAEEGEKAHVRRAAWQAAEPDLDFILRFYADLGAQFPPPDPKDLPRVTLSRDDWQAMARDVEAMRKK
jgi:hypothetical protein